MSGVVVVIDCNADVVQKTGHSQQLPIPLIQLVQFLPAAKHRKGTVELRLPNGVPEAGKYLIHITLVPDADKPGTRLDAHMGFKAGGGQAASKSNLLLYAFFALAGLYALYLSNAGFKGMVDKAIGKVKE